MNNAAQDAADQSQSTPLGLGEIPQAFAWVSQATLIGAFVLTH